MTSKIAVIHEDNLSTAWCRSFEHAISRNKSQTASQMVSIGGFEGDLPLEDASVEKAIDDTLVRLGIPLTCSNVSFTIFPDQLWEEGEDPEKTFERWRRAYPRLLRRASRKNSQWVKGLYFNRMIAYDNGSSAGLNQLLHIINIWKEGVHNSMGLQISCFDPRKDHNRSRQRSFPCLQQVGLTVEQHRPRGYELTINAFYPVQNITVRAYGNYQGLCRLGRFMALHMEECTFKRLNCFIGKPTWGGRGIRKKDLEPLIVFSRDHLSG